MKKSILTVLLLTTLLLSVGCNKEEPTKEESTEKSETTESDAKAEENEEETSDTDPAESNTQGKQPAEIDTTTGKIYAPSSGGIRPEDATKSSFDDRNTKLSASSKTKIRSPRNK